MRARRTFLEVGNPLGGFEEGVGRRCLPIFEHFFALADDGEVAGRTFLGEPSAVSRRRLKRIAKALGTGYDDDWWLLWHVLLCMLRKVVLHGRRLPVACGCFFHAAPATACHDEDGCWHPCHHPKENAYRHTKRIWTQRITDAPTRCSYENQ